MVMKANKTKGNKTIRDLRFDNEKKHQRHTTSASAD